MLWSFFKAQRYFLAGHSGSFCAIKANDDRKQWLQGILHGEIKTDISGFSCIPPLITLCFSDSRREPVHTGARTDLPPANLQATSKLYYREYLLTNSTVQTKPDGLSTCRIKGINESCIVLDKNHKLMESWNCSFGAPSEQILCFFHTAPATSAFFFFLAQTATVCCESSLIHCCNILCE